MGRQTCRWAGGDMCTTIGWHKSMWAVGQISGKADVQVGRWKHVHFDRLAREHVGGWAGEQAGTHK